MFEFCAMKSWQITIRGQLFPLSFFLITGLNSSVSHFISTRTTSQNHIEYLAHSHGIVEEKDDHSL